MATNQEFAEVFRRAAAIQKPLMKNAFSDRGWGFSYRNCRKLCTAARISLACEGLPVNDIAAIGKFEHFIGENACFWNNRPERILQDVQLAFLDFAEKLDPNPDRDRNWKERVPLVVGAVASALALLSFLI